MKYWNYYVWVLIISLITTGCQDNSIEKEIPVTPPTEENEDEKPAVKPDTDSFVSGKQCVLLDLTHRNGDNEEDNENGRNLYSASYILEVAGIPNITLTDFSEALEKGNLIVFSSPVKSQTLKSEEWQQLSTWVKNGGVVVAPALVDVVEGASQLFGVSASNFNKLRTSFTWESKFLNEKELEYVDEPEEYDISLGNAKGKDDVSSIKTYGYTLNDADALALFNTGEVAVTRHSLGDGYVYSFGLLWRDVIQRSQLNKDFSASRSYSNDFEPSADTYALFIRSVYAKQQEVSVWKFTSPDGYQSVLIPTHDCDSRTAYDEMHYMSTYEKGLGLKAHFFLTVHYYRDISYLSAFYDETSIQNSKKLLEDGHTVGSHSIGHFPDFSKTERFPITIVTKDDYRPHHDVETKITEGGSTWAEIALSKQIIEEDLGNKVRSFRTGHLTMNKNIPIVMKEAGYSFSSCYSAGDVLGAFPFFERIGNAWEGEQSSVLQMPLHFSDVINSDPMTEENWMEKPALWLKILNKLKGNYAPSILLIHPNREWKMLAQKMLVESMDRNSVGLYNFEAYGDFWLQRHDLKFEYCFLKESDKVIIQVDKLDTENKAYTFGIDCNLSIAPSVVVMDKGQNMLQLRVKKIAENRYLAY